MADQTCLQHDHQPPGDPRLAIPGYPVSCFNNDRPNKARLRPAPYTVKPYSWDSRTSVGRGPATRVVVHGFDPLMVTETKIRSALGQYGDVSEVNNLTDPQTGAFLGICTVSYRDRLPARGERGIKAIDAARRAEKEGSGQRIDQWTVKIDRDAEAVRSKRMADRVIKKRQESLALLLQQERTVTPTATSMPKRDVPVAPPNAPRGPAPKPPQGPKPNVKPPPAPKPAAHVLVENEPVIGSLKRKPYIFVAHCYVPVLGTTIKHLQNRMRMYDWRDVRCDRGGYYLIFDDSKRGEDECARCFRESHMQPLFTYTMNMECQQYGNPNYERSPTPERVAAEQLERDERKKVREEDELDYVNEKRHRAKNLDLATAALEKLFPELTSMILADIKAGIVKPKVFELLNPERHVDRRKRLGIPDPSIPDTQRPLGFAGRADEVYSGGYRKSFSRFDRKKPTEVRSTGNAFTDERRRRRPQRPMQNLHRRLVDFIDSDESEDERHTSVTRASDGADSRPLSDASKSPARFEVDDDGYLTPHTKRPKLDSPWSMDSDQESTDVPLISTHKAKSADKEPEDMSMTELKKLVSSSTLSKNTKLYKRAVAELQRRKDSDFVDERATVHDETDSITATPEPADITKANKKVAKTTTKRKTKKEQLVEDAASATPEASAEIEHEVSVVEEVEEGAISWQTTNSRRRIVEDDMDIVLDLDGWQNLVKTDEDLRLLKEALADYGSVALNSEPNTYAWTEKQIKRMNNGNLRGPVKVSPLIDGYYVPNGTGCARSEGYRKIKQDEKGLYLPHRIKVKEQREKLQDEARKNKSHGANGVLSVDEKTHKAVAALNSNVTSRSYRAESRRLNNEIQQTLSLIQLENADVAIRFNQLKKRKKLVRFDRSSIHGWGLYTQENIVANDMIIEYVGEKVRQRVADVREWMYDKQGVGSSYLFRIDDDMVIDATKKGGIARFINHSCMPNCTAKIISVGRSKRIVIYALRDVAKGMFLCI
jgi:[histone H3]-lysine4 N-trimethyltransferase SETD1